MKRTETNKIKIGNLTIGGTNTVLIQSMCNIKTSKVSEICEQINDCARLGADLMRVSIVDKEDALALKEIKKHISIPLVADIHFDYRLALLAIENGADKIRINPGNIGSIDKIQQVVDACKKANISIRIGINSGSLDKEIIKEGEKVTHIHLVNSAKKHVKIIEDMGFTNIVLSLKASDVKETIAAYRLASKTFKYPLHLGITEAGTKDVGVIRSVAGLSPLLLEGIGDTIRISLTDSPQEEIKVCKRLLHDIGLYPNYPILISCPTCGRTEVDVKKVASQVLELLEYTNKKITVAVMGCPVNGPGEAKHADIGLAGGKKKWVLFKKGQVIDTIDEKDAFTRLKKEIESFK